MKNRISERFNHTNLYRQQQQKGPQTHDLPKLLIKQVSTYFHFPFSFNLLGHNKGLKENKIKIELKNPTQTH